VDQGKSGCAAALHGLAAFAFTFAFTWAAFWAAVCFLRSRYIFNVGSGPGATGLKTGCEPCNRRESGGSITQRAWHGRVRASDEFHAGSVCYLPLILPCGAPQPRRRIRFGVFLLGETQRPNKKCLRAAAVQRAVGGAATSSIAEGPVGGDAVGATEVATVTRDWSNWCAVNVQTTRTPGLAVGPTVGTAKRRRKLQVSPVAIYATFCSQAELLSTA
jgi:hypothetical protein